MTSASRRLPPGWTTATAPASATTSSPSRNGKNASDATTEPASARSAFCALIAAMRAESMRLICPAPTPSVLPSRQNTMALDFTNLATRHANSRSSFCCGEGCTFVTILRSAALMLKSSGVCTSSPPPTRFNSCALAPAASGTSSTRTFSFLASAPRAATETCGAISTSTNCSATAAAVAASSSRLNAMMPPNAEVGSVAKAAR